MELCGCWDQNSEDFASEGLFVTKFQDVTRGFVTFKEKKYFIKTPHSRFYKFGFVNMALSNRDNKLATTSELISEKKYKHFNYMSAPHKAIFKPDQNEYLLRFKHKKLFGEYVLVSPILFNSDIHYASMSDFQTQENFFNKAARVDQLLFGNFENTLKNKKHFLKYMTEGCYDEYVKYLLLSLFEFSDDEHLGNVMLCKNKNVERFERLFIYDKESTAFNPFVANDLESSSLIYKTNNFSRYNGVPFFAQGERSIERILALTKLVADGKVPKKYCLFLNEISNIDYEKFAREVFEETGIVVEKKQIDMYKYGSDCAGEIFEKNV